MTRTCTQFAFLCLALCFSLTASTQSNPKPGHEPHLQAIDWMTRGTWTAEFKTPAGKDFLIQNEIRWAETGAAIYFLTRFNHEPHYYGVYLYDPAANQIKFFYSSSDGEFTVGQSEPGATEIKQNFQVSSARGVNTFNSLIKRVGDDAYDFTVYQSGGEKPLIAVHYVRK